MMCFLYIIVMSFLGTFAPGMLRCRRRLCRNRSNTCDKCRDFRTFGLIISIYGIKDSPRGWSKLFSSVCLNYGFDQLKSHECMLSKLSPIPSPANPLTPSPPYSTPYRMCPNVIVSTKTARTKIASSFFAATSTTSRPSLTANLLPSICLHTATKDSP